MGQPMDKPSGDLSSMDISQISFEYHLSRKTVPACFSSLIESPQLCASTAQIQKTPQNLRTPCNMPIRSMVCSMSLTELLPTQFTLFKSNSCFLLARGSSSAAMVGVSKSTSLERALQSSGSSVSSSLAKGVFSMQSTDWSIVLQNSLTLQVPAGGFDL